MIKNTLFFLIFSLGYLNIDAQVFQSENFDGLTIGNVGTDVTGASSGQGGLFTQDNSGQNSDFQIVDEGSTQDHVLQITGSATATGTKFVWKGGLNTDWGSRTSGNDILEVEFDFFTGPTTTSKNSVEVRMFDNSFITIAGFSFNPETKVLIGLAKLDDMGTPTLFGFNLGPGNTEIILNADTWHRVGFAFNKTTGDVIWKGPGFYAGLTSVDAGTDPFEVDFIVFAGTGNTLSFNAKIDDYRIRAINTENLLGIGDHITNLHDSIKLFPNPVEDILNFSIANTISPTKMEIVDLNGRIVKSISPENIYNNRISLSELNKGLYFFNIYSLDGKTSKKIVKK